MSRVLTGLAFGFSGYLLVTLALSRPNPTPNTPQRGTELVAVLLTSTDCSASRRPGLQGAWREAIRAVREVLPDSIGLRTVGVNIASDLSGAVEFLEGFGAFDELSVGSGARNAVFNNYTDGDFSGPSVTPQVLLLQRRYSETLAPLLIDETMVARLRGSDGMMRAREVWEAAAREWTSNSGDGSPDAGEADRGAVSH